MYRLGRKRNDKHAGLIPVEDFIDPDLAPALNSSLDREFVLRVLNLKKGEKLRSEDLDLIGDSCASIEFAPLIKNLSKNLIIIPKSACFCIFLVIIMLSDKFIWFLIELNKYSMFFFLEKDILIFCL